MAATVAAQLAALVQVVNQLKERADEDRNDLKDYHEKLQKELEAERKLSETYRAAIQKELSVLTAGQKDILRRVEVIEPVAGMVNSFRAKLIGAGLVLGAIGSIAIWSLTYFRETIHRLFFQ